MRLRRIPLPALLFLSVLAPAPAPAQSAPVPVLIIDGKGFGHGVGMAQDGAYWMGRSGASTAQILGHFYPGTGIGKASGAVRVNVLAAGGRTVLAFPRGGEVRDGRSGSTADGFPIRVEPGGTVSVAWTGNRYVATPGPGATLAASAAASPSRASGASPVPSPSPSPAQTGGEPPPSTSTTTTAPNPVPTTSTTRPGPVPPPSSSTTTTTTPEPEPEPGHRQNASSPRPLVASPGAGGTITVAATGRTYRGLVEATAAGGPFRLVNEVDVETYLKGMGEVRNPSWPPASLRAQAIAARTYAMRAMAVAGELCDTQRCQVYLGATAEYAAMNKAVADSSAQVVTYGRGLASTVYSANGGGFSASREEGFGTTGEGFPYLRPAPYPTQDPVPWSVTVSQRDVAARLGYPGELSAVTVTQRGPSGRATEVALDGAGGRKLVDGRTFDAALGLKSTLFDLRSGEADAPPPPPPPTELQAPPDSGATLPMAVATLPGDDVGRPDDVAAAPLTGGGLASGLGLLGLILQGLALLAVPAALRLRPASNSSMEPVRPTD